MERPASLIPENDPSLLFTGAGMNQFKELFFGSGNSDLKRAATCQRCVRATDIENVGRTTRHLTFIEMLGNFSFGDYFKEEAITWAWEFMLKILKLPEEKLVITIYKDDEETSRIWEREIGIPGERIFPLGEEDNFWNMGKTGPCGPCSEIIFDKGEEYGCGRDSCSPACDCDRHLELWNLVFTQFNRQENGRLEPLRQKNIDTGMGLERIASVMQNVPSVFDIDIIQPVVSEIRAQVQESNAESARPANIIADHIRTVTFCIADGIMPSNEGRGYVLRKLIRRAVQQGRNIGEKEPFLYRLVPLVINEMSTFYTELNGRHNDIGIVVKAEEERFFSVFQKLPELEEKIRELSEKGVKQLPADVYFKYYDTYGIPQETIRESAVECGMQEIDEEGFRKALNSQRQRSRSASGFSASREGLPETGEKTEFTGYEELETNSKILSITRGLKNVSEAGKGEAVGIITGRTPFYGESGGQAGDQGEIAGENWKFKVTGTSRAGTAIVHEGTVLEGILRKGDSARLSVDSAKRFSTAANHTATHLLQYSLRQVLGEHVHQCGSFSGPIGLRFDFTHTGAVSVEELSKIEELVNRLVVENHPVEVLEMSLEKAVKMGAIALFGEKYGEKVRVVKIGNYSMELCGGTHARYTGEIGLFLIENESSISTGVRRIEAVSRHRAYLEARRARLVLSEMGEILKSAPEELADRAKKLVESMRSLEKKLETLRVKEASSGIQTYLSGAKSVCGVKVIAIVCDGVSPGGLRQIADELKAKIGSGIVILGTVSGGGVHLLGGVTDDLVKQGWHAGELIKKTALIVGGSGGGRADFAQAGGKNADRLRDAIESVPGIIKEHAKKR